MRKVLYFLGIILIPLNCFSQAWIVSQHLKSDNDLRILDIKKDAGNNVYVTGIFKGTYNGNTSEGLFDIFLAKFNSDLNKEWIQTVGSSSVEFDPRITLDAANNIFLTGAFRDSCVFDENIYLKSDGNYDIFLAKYSNVGNIIWAKNIANYPTQQNPTDIDVDGNNDLIITGHFSDSTYLINQKIVSSGRNSFFAKIDTSGTKIWVNYVPGNNISSRINNIKVYQDEYYFNGYFRDEMYFDIETITSNIPGQQDLFIYKTDINGNGLWIRRTYGDNLDATGSIAGDNYGNVYFTGYFQSSTLAVDSTDISLSSQILTNNNDFDIFILKYNKNGNLQWNKQFGLNGRDYGVDVNVNNDILYMSGYFSDTIAFGEYSLESTGTGDRDMFITVMDLNAKTFNSISLGGIDGNDLAAGALVLEDGDAIISGYFQSSSISVGDSLFMNASPGFRDGIVAEYRPPLSAVFSNVENIACNSDNDGELTITAEFGQKPYTYSWSHDGGLTDSTAIGLSAATYTVTVTDAVDSTAVVSYDLTEPDEITFNPLVTQVSQCSYSKEGVIDLNAAGGNGGYTYQWQASEGGDGIVLSAEDQSGLAIGRYDVTITDTELCTNDTITYITGPAPITFGGSVVTDSSGIGPGAIDLSYTGGSGSPASFTFDWIGPSGPPATHSEDTSNLSPGNYSVTVTDVHLCEFDTTFNVANLDTFYIFISDQKDACLGTINGNATVSFSSPKGHTLINYLWDVNAGSQTTAKATNLAPGRYYKVTVTDTENTPNTTLVDSVYIDELIYNLAGSLSGTTTLDCYGDTDGYIDLTITIAGELPYTYNWSTGSNLQDITDLGIGNYSVTVTDDNECTFSITNYAINQPELLTASAEIINEPSCNGDFDGEVTVDRNGGTAPYTYQWDDPGFQDTRNADGLDAGYYTVTVTDVNNCMTLSGINLTEPDVVSISKVISDEICNSAGEGAVTLTTTGGTDPFGYSWTTTDGSGLISSNKNQTGLTAGKYYFTATDNNGCAFMDSAEITEPELLQITNESKTDVNTCNGDNTGTITIAASGGTGILTYTLNPGNIQTNNTGAFTSLGAGNYTVNVEDENACAVASSSLSIAEPALLIITRNDVNDATCYGINNGNIDINVSGGTISSGYTFNWTTSDGSGLVAGSEDQPSLGNGTYDLTVTDDNLCSDNTSFVLTEPEAIIVNKTVYEPSCNDDNDGTVIVTHSGGTLPFSYFWTTTDGSGLDPVYRNQGGLSPGTYYLEITDALDCIINEAVTITAPSIITIDSQSSTDATDFNTADGTISVTASGGTSTLTYVLRPDDISNQTGTFNSLLPGEYVIEVDDIYFCGPITTDTITIGAINSVNLIFAGDFIKVFPNPTSSKVFVEIDMNATFKLELASMSGQILYQDEIITNGFMKEEIDLSSFTKGIYLLRIYNNEYYLTDKLILQ